MAADLDAATLRVLAPSAEVLAQPDRSFKLYRAF